MFLFDEPLSNLDAALRGEMRREIAALHRTLGATMLYVTHDQVEAMTLGDRIVVMHDGRIAQVGTPSDVYDHPRDTFVASFLGSPPMNLLPGTLVRSGDVLSVRLAGTDNAVVPLSPSLAAAAQQAGVESVILGLRPEDVEAVVTESTRVTAPGRLRGIIELVEPLGHEQLLHLRVDDALLTVRGTARERPPLGVTVALTVDPTRMHLFDSATKRAVLG